MQTFVDRLARTFSILGGVTLTFLIILICLSVLGRSLNGIFHSDSMEALLPSFAAWALSTGVGPINGDFEIVEAGMAFAIFAFLPLCQLHSAHASVDIFTSKLPPRVGVWLRALIEVIFAAVLVLIAWQLFLGTGSKFRSGQTTLLLQFPAWWSYAASLIAMTVAALVAVYVGYARLAEAMTGRLLLPEEEEAIH